MTAITRSGQGPKKAPVVDRRREQDREHPSDRSRSSARRRSSGRTGGTGGTVQRDPLPDRRPRAERGSPVRVTDQRPDGQRPGDQRAPVQRRRPGRRLTQRKRYENQQRLPSVWKAGRPRRRLLAVFVVIMAALGAVLARVGYLQAGGDPELLADSAARKRTTTIQADRGIIFAYDGEPLSMSIPSTTIWANPKKIVDPQAVAAQLAPILGLTVTERGLLAQALGADQQFVFVKRQLEPEIAAKIEALKIDGIGWYTESKRIAPSGDIARSLVGSTDIDGVGTGGLELQYDDLLKPTMGEAEHEIALRGHAIPGSEKVAQQPVPGDDLVLTIHRSLQLSTEERLITAVKEQGAKGATVVITEVHSGNVLALANVRVDPDTGAALVSSKNLALDAFEPGSVAKVITMAAGLNEGVVKPDSYFRVPNRKTYFGFAITDAEYHKPDMTARQILAMSSNNGTILVSLQTDKSGATQEKYMRLFGLGEKTALDLPGEPKGILRSAAEWKGSDRVAVAYGYGASATALQLAAAVNTVANGGTYVAPRLVDARIDKLGNRVQEPASATHEVLKPSAAHDLTTMMQAVVCEGTARRTVPIDGLSIAGKTGTAFKAVDGKYVDAEGRRRYRASFMGFFPAEAPQISMFVTFDEPTNHSSGAMVAGPVFHDLAKVVVRELGIESPVADGGCK